jgi:hypothetical protein
MRRERGGEEGGRDRGEEGGGERGRGKIVGGSGI